MQQQLQKNFPKFGNIRKPCIYQEIDSAYYDAGSGSVIKNIVSEHPLMAIFDEASTGAVSNINVDEDTSRVRELKVAIFPALDLPITPKNHDRIVMENSSVWSVCGNIGDPADAHYELVIRPWEAE